MTEDEKKVAKPDAEAATAADAPAAADATSAPCRWKSRTFKTKKPLAA